MRRGRRSQATGRHDLVNGGQCSSWLEMAFCAAAGVPTRAVGMRWSDDDSAAGYGTAVWSSTPWQDRRGCLAGRAVAGGRRPSAPDRCSTRTSGHGQRRSGRRPVSGVVWLKATGPGTSFEVRLYPLLARLVPEQVLTPIAADPERGWIVLPDGGPSLGEQLDRRRRWPQAHGRRPGAVRPAANRPGRARAGHPGRRCVGHAAGRHAGAVRAGLEIGSAEVGPVRPGR